MKFKADYEHIFFDRYPVDKKKEAEKILTTAFEEIGCSIFIDNGLVTVEETDIESGMRIYEVIKLLKEEFFIILKEYSEAEETVVKNSFKEAEQYIRGHYPDENLSIEAVCVKYGVSRSALDRFFTDEAGMTASEYIRHMRVKTAKELIFQGEKMDAVASLCGFGSVKTMQRAFKSVYGKSPGEYRVGKLDSKEQE